MKVLDTLSSEQNENEANKNGLYCWNYSEKMKEMHFLWPWPVSADREKVNTY